MNHVVSSFLLFSLANTDFYEQNKILVVDILSAPGLRLSASGSQRLLLEFSPEATSSSVAVATPPSPLATIPAATSARHGFFRLGFDAWDVLSPVSFGTTKFDVPLQELLVGLPRFFPAGVRAARSLTACLTRSEDVHTQLSFQNQLEMHCGKVR